MATSRSSEAQTEVLHEGKLLGLLASAGWMSSPELGSGFSLRRGQWSRISWNLESIGWALHVPQRAILDMVCVCVCVYVHIHMYI